jgi:hypothetical protein
VTDQQESPLEYETPQPATHEDGAAGGVMVGLVCALVFLFGCFFLYGGIRSGLSVFRPNWGWAKFRRSDEFVPAILGS